MRILAIKGANLASLAEPFVIDFEAQPLLSSGLFAITGETGAGKSTLLDALCLALFDKFPRVVSTASGEGAPDASGETLSSNDPRIILRRGASAGYAEVDFIARDCQRYRVRCDLLRARGNARGKLQNRLRSLWRIDSNGLALEAIETGIEPVNRRIVELTDLTFEQFRRTALLAQGDFDAFLRADARERAELLEKITGVEIYAKISQRVFEEAREAQGRVNWLENKRAEVGVLAEDVRGWTLRDADETLQTRQRCEEAYRVTQNSLRQLELFEQAQGRLLLAQQAQAESRRALDALTPKIAYLEKRRHFEPLRLNYLKVKEAEALTLKLDEQFAELKTQLEATKEAQSKLVDEETAAQKNLEEINLIQEQLSPLWQEALRLDIAIKTLNPGALEARAAVNERIQKLNENISSLADAQQRRLDLAAERSALKDEMAGFADISQLAQQQEEIEPRLDSRHELLTENQKTLTHAHRLRRQISSATNDLAELAASEVQALAQREQYLRAIHSYEHMLKEQQGDEAEERFRNSLEKISKINTLLERASDFMETAKVKRKTEKLSAAAVKELRVVSERLIKLKEQQDRQVSESMEARRLGDLAEAMNAPESLRLRASLQSGRACPVCGSLQHVFNHEETAAQQLVGALRAKREAMLQLLTQTGAEVIALSAQESALRAESVALQRQEDALTQGLVKSQQEFEEFFKAAAIDLKPMEIDQAVEPLTVFKEQASESHDQLEQNVKSIKDLRILRDKSRRKLDVVNLSLDQIQEKRVHLSEKKHLCVLEEARLSQIFARNQDRLIELDRFLTPVLHAYGLSTRIFEETPALAHQTIKNKAARLLALRRALEICDKEVFSCDLEISRREAQKIEFSQDLSLAQQACEAKENSLRALKERRSSLLMAEDVELDRKEIEVQRRAAQEQRDQLKAQLTEIEKNAALIDMQFRECFKKLTNAREHYQDLDSSLRDSLAQSGLEISIMRQMLDDDEDLSQIQALINQAKETLAITESTRIARHNDLQEIIGLLAPDLSRDRLIETSDRLKQQIDACSIRIGALRQLLETDDHALARVLDINKEISLALAQRHVWDEINEAVGSKSGDKFRRFAQSMTLEHLIELANQRLVYFTLRYVLEKSSETDDLGIHVIDRDLGDERRSTRSLSGGERFLVSLALALALAGLEGRESFIDTLFIDEGFGSLDSATLDIAIDALENLQGQGRRVGVISHVDALQERIATKICVERWGGGKSVVRIEGAL